MDLGGVLINGLLNLRDATIGAEELGMHVPHFLVQADQDFISFRLFGHRIITRMIRRIRARRVIISSSNNGSPGRRGEMEVWPPPPPVRMTSTRLRLAQRPRAFRCQPLQLPGMGPSSGRVPWLS